ncbi:MAG: cytochrome c [Xanthobacteraceae bacterium]
MATATTTHSSEPSALRWYRRLVWAGIAANIVVGIVSIAFTAQVLALARVDPATPLVWPRLSAMLVMLLAGFYIPAAIDPCAHRFAAVFAVVCRFAGTIFMAVVGGHYIIFGLFDFIFGAPQAICLYLAWERMRAAAEGRAPRGRIVAVLAGLLALAVFAGGAFQWLMAPILPAFASDEEYFKYGSIGNDGASGIPYPIWVAMPEVCAQHLPRPQGYAAFGLLHERGRNPALDPPVGFSRARVGVDRMSINCAVCHTVRARLAPDAEPQLYFGGAANTVDIQGYQRFLSRCAADDRFTADHLIPAMAAKVELSWLDRLMYRFVLIPYVRKRLLEQGEAFAWANRRPAWGPGRIDPFNPVKFGMLRLADDGTIGNSDMQAVWNLNARERIRSPAPLHWDGLNNSVREVVISSALGDGAVAKEFNFPAMERIERYLRALPPPPSPHRPDAAAVERGKVVFAASCAECHAPDGKRTLTEIAVAEVGTDINRSNMWTEAARDTYNNYREGRDWGFKSFRKIAGYVAEPLEGMWLNGPYLHNGSVPTLRDLLEPPARRPVTFVRGLDVLDANNGGFVAPSCDPRQIPAEGFCFDTRLVGNGNGGHDYGTALPAAEKNDLVAYLLTF